MSDKDYLGAYKGQGIRLKKNGALISLTDIYKATKAKSKYRSDKWLKIRETQEFLQSLAKKKKRECLFDKNGNIVEIIDNLEVYRGGDRLSQGTFGCFEIAKRYAEAIDEEFCKWFSDMVNPVDSQEIIRAERAIIILGEIELSVYRLPDNSYRLNQTQVCKAIGKDEFQIRDFLASNSPEALPYKGFKSGKIKGIGEKGAWGKAVPTSLTIAFWTKEGAGGNQLAVRLLGACAVEAIERRADKAFGVNRSEEEHNQRFINVYDRLIANHPEVAYVTTPKNDNIRVSTPLRGFYEAVKNKLKKRYSQGVIEGYSKEEIRDDVALLATYSSLNCWKLTSQKELTYELEGLTRSKYPDLVSGKIPINFNGIDKEAVFIFQIYDRIIDIKAIEDCALKRQYVQIAKRCIGVDYAFLWLVAPLGGTPDCYSFIANQLPDGKNGCSGYVGILTLKELVSFYKNIIFTNLKQNKIKGEINKKFKPISEYQIPNSPLDLLAEGNNYQGLQLSLPV